MFSTIGFCGLASGFYVLLRAYCFCECKVSTRFCLGLLFRFGGNSDRFRLVSDFGDLLLFDLFNANFTFSFNFSGADGLFAVDFRFLNLSFSQNSRLLCFTTTFSFKSRNTCILFGSTGFNLLLLLKRHKRFLLFNLQLARKCITVFLTHRNFYILFNFVTFATTALRLLRQLG